MKYYSTLCCLLFAIAVNNSTTAKAQPVDVNDSLALVDLYNSTKGFGWYDNTNWLTTNPVSTWAGITVTDTRVTSIELEGNNMIGTIPSSIGNLVNLSYLDLYNNQLSGEIPSSIGNLVNLIYLFLYHNQLSGSIPSSIGNLVNLQSLYLLYNQLSGSIPSSIGNLVNLQFLYLYHNQLSGSIPSSIGNLVNLTDLNLYDNLLCGSIPASVGNLVNLSNLGLSNNQLSGSIPSSIGNMINLYSLYLDNNQLSGTIPASVGNLVNLQTLHLDNNQLSGTIPASVGNLVNFYALNLSNNQLSGSIPSSIGNLIGLRYLELHNNLLSGNIPISFRKLHHLYTINLSHNQLSQSNNIDYPMAHPQKNGYRDISYNHFTFNGLEFVAKKFSNAIYDPQAIIPVHQNGNVLSVYAGGTLNNNTYNWFRVGSTDSTTVKGDSTFTPTQDGKYCAKVTNSIATQLTLYSDTVDFTVNSPIANNQLAVDVKVNKMKQRLQVFPNPARSTVNIQLNGTATIVLTNEDGKVMLTKTVTNNATINVSHLAPGIYYVQNKTNGEVKQVVVVH